ncbi:hypothetical protein GCM10028822_30450 [Hymenobacter terrigena]
MKKHLLPALLSLLLLLNLCGSARAATPPPTTGRPLAEALNPDGTLKAGAKGSFNAHRYKLRTAPDGRPTFRPLGTTAAGDERWQDGFGPANGTNGKVFAMAVSGNDVYIGGDFTAVNGVPAGGVAKWNGTAWSALGSRPVNGVNRVYKVRVLALAVAPNGDVYVGGNFTQAGGLAASRIARWNGTAWSALGTGLNSTVSSLAVAGNGDVYAGGSFTQAGGVPANCVAKWNGTTWSALGAGAAYGIPNITALAIAPNGDVYTGASGYNGGGAARVAKWNGTTWSPVGTGMGTGNVLAMAVSPNGDVYVGGQFSQAGGVPATNVAKWNGTAWSALGTGLNSTVSSLAVAGGGEVYAVGNFTQAGGLPADCVAKWNGTTWSPLSNGVRGLTTGVYAYVELMACAVAANGDVYAGGNFLQAGSTGANNVAKWNGTAWNSLGTAVGNGLNDVVSAVAVAGNGDVYVGGNFTQAGNVVANHIARWNGTAWSSLGTGAANGVTLNPAFSPYYNVVNAIAVAGNGDVYVGGTFTQAGGATASYVAKWNGIAWSSLGTGTANGVDNKVNALAIASNGDLYVGGAFTQAGGAAANRIAKWNGTAWSSVGSSSTTGVRGIVWALAIAANGDLYAADGSLYRWDGVAWSSLPPGPSVEVIAIAGSGDIYTGGARTTYLTSKWNGTAWSLIGNLGGNPPGNGAQVLGVYTLALGPNGMVYAGGFFPGFGISQWDGTSWSAVPGSNADEIVRCLAIGQNGKLYVGGSFTNVGDGSKSMSYFGIYDPNAPPLATKAPAATPAAQLYPNPAHGTATLRLPAGAPRQPLLLTDALGRTVRRYPAPAAAEAELDLHGLPAGTYVVRCGQLSQRLVVE